MANYINRQLLTIFHDSVEYESPGMSWADGRNDSFQIRIIIISVKILRYSCILAKLKIKRCVDSELCRLSIV